MMFFLPVLAYLLWHFSVEAYNWGEVWVTAKVVSNGTPDGETVWVSQRAMPQIMETTEMTVEMR